MKTIIKSIAPAALVASVLSLGMSNASADIRFGMDSAPYPPFSETSSSGDMIGWEVE